MQRATDADFAKQLTESARRMQLMSVEMTPNAEATAINVRIQERVEKTMAKREKLRQLEAKKAAKLKEMRKTKQTQESGDPCTAEPNSKKSNVGNARGKQSNKPADQSRKKAKATATPTVKPTVRPIRNAARAVDYREEPQDEGRYNDS
jgi:hypothetical protein